MAKRKLVNNNGFSLVELIIVIAIMAILAGAIAPAVIRYIRKARASRATDEARVIVGAVEAALATKAGEDAEILYTNTFVDSDGNSKSVGLVTNWILGEAQSGTVLTVDDPEYSNYVISLEILENLSSSTNHAYKFFNFTGNKTNAIGMNCDQFASAYDNCPGVIVAYSPNGTVIMMEYYNYGCLIHYENNEYTYYEDEETFISSDRVR